MTIFVVETYVVKPGKQRELISLLKRMREYKEKNPEGFREMKSRRIFSQMFGGVAGKYVELNEFDSLAEAEKYFARTAKDEGFIKLYKEALQLVVPATYSLNVWKALE
jgi:heme-degrading monooxygenase HmoA